MTFALIFASLDSGVTQLSIGTSISHRANFSSSEWRNRKNGISVRVTFLVAKKGGPPGGRPRAASVKIDENSIDFNGFQ